MAFSPHPIGVETIPTHRGGIRVRIRGILQPGLLDIWGRRATPGARRFMPAEGGLHGGHRHIWWTSKPLPRLYDGSVQGVHYVLAALIDIDQDTAGADQ